MSIQDVINSHDGIELDCIGSLFPGDETPRFIYVNRDVADFIWNQDDTREGHIGQNAGALIDDFVAGGHITVGLDPYNKDRTCIMARVDSPDPQYDMWDIRCLDPNPGARVIGAFSEKDCFIALTWDYRDNFDRDWPGQIQRCIDEWKRLFGNLLPITGTAIDDFISPPHSAS